LSKPATIIVASLYKPLINLLERAMYGTEATIRQVDPNVEIVLKTAGESQNPLVVLCERKGNDDWLYLAKSLQHNSPRLKVIAFGESTDVGVVARGIVRGLRNHVPLAFGSDLLEIRRIVANTVAGVDAPADSIYGRAKVMLPSGTGGTSFRSAGKPISAEDAIQQCISLGLSHEETAGLLSISVGDVNKVAEKALRRPRVSVGIPEASMRLLSRLALGLLVVALIAFGAQRFGYRPFPYELVPLSGTVNVDDRPLSEGHVLLIPDHSKGTKGPTGAGRIDAQGRFRIATAGRDGAVLGFHRVVVMPSSIQGAGPSGSEGSSSIPSIYTTEALSGLTAEVKRGSSSALILSLRTPPVRQAPTSLK